MCPVCSISIGVGVGLCRYLGIDDLISGVWIGGFFDVTDASNNSLVGQKRN